MSNEANTSEQLVQAAQGDATGAYAVPSAPTSATEADANATGAYALPDAAKPDNTQVLPPEPDGATTILPPAQAEPDSTTVLPPAVADAPSPVPLTDATVESATGALQPDLTGATSVFDTAAATQARPKQEATVSRGRQNLDATGAFQGDSTGGAADGDLGGATRAVDGADVNGVAQEEAPVHHCGRYILKRFHAKGGMGEIWLAEDPDIGRSVALKRMLTNRADQQRRFRVEAQVTGQLEHPGIVPIHELGVNEQGQPFYVMKFVHGRTLQKVIDEYHADKAKTGDHEVEQFRLLQIFTSLCQTVAYAHSRGVLHRDLKPENVMLGPYGETLLLDWGIAKVLGQPESPDGEVAADAEYVHLLEGGPDSQTRAGTIMGSLSFMSPEVAFGKNAEVDQRSDVFLLGGILYTILTGRPPRRGKNAMELIKQAQTELPPAPRKVNAKIAKPLEAICLKALALRREDRYQSALALANDIQRYAAGEPVSAYQESFLERSWRWAKKHRTALVRTAGAVLVAGLLVFGLIKYREIEAQQAAKLQAAEADRIKTQRENERLATEKKARGDWDQFRSLADEARYYAATTDPVSENAPYYNPQAAQTKAKAAVALAGNWGAGLEQLPLPEADREQWRGNLYDLLVLLAQGQLQQATRADAGKEALSLLAQAEPLRARPTRGWYRLQAAALRLTGDADAAANSDQRAEAPETPETAQDLFLRGEQYRTESAGKGKEDKPAHVWQHDPKQLEKAVEQYRLALRIDPNHFWSYFQLGRCYLALGKFAEAGEALGACVALQPKAPWGYSARGLALAQQRRYAEAEKDFDTAIALNPEAMPPRLNRGVVYWLQKKNKEALADFDAVLDAPRGQRLVEAAFYRGQLNLQLGKKKEALEDFNLLVTENPAFRPVYRYRARIHVADGDNDRAVKDLTTFLAVSTPTPIDAESAAAYAARGNLLRFLFLEVPAEQRANPANQALLDLGLSQLKTAVEKGGHDPRLFDDLATVLNQLGKTDEALAALSEGLTINKNDAFLLNARGWLYVGANNLDKALADFTTACRAEPKNGEAHSGVGYVRALLKADTEAQQEAELALLHGADKYLVLHNVACIYATLSQVRGKPAAAHQDVAMALLHRAVEQWQREEAPTLNEIELMKIDPALEPLRNRQDFKDLIDSKGQPLK